MTRTERDVRCPPGTAGQGRQRSKPAVFLDLVANTPTHERIRFKSLWSFTDADGVSQESRGFAGCDNPVSVIVDELGLILSLDPRQPAPTTDEPTQTAKLCATMAFDPLPSGTLTRP